MTTVKDYKVTEKKLRAYVQGDKSKLNLEQLTAICSDYLNKVMRKQDKWRKWPKDVQREMRKYGVIQSTSTSYPIMTARKKKSWAEQMTAEASELVEVMEALEKAEAKIKELQARIDDLEHPEPMDTINLTEEGAKALDKALTEPPKISKKMADAAKEFKEVTKDELS